MVSLAITSSGTARPPITAWPFRSGIWGVGQGYLRRIPYCYVDKRSFDKVGRNCKFEHAIELWAYALGGKASKRNQHSLVVQKPQDPDDYCCTEYTYGQENQPEAEGDLHCVWNTAKYPKDALAIHWLDDIKLDGGAAQAEVGYTTEENDPDAGRHWIHIGDDAEIVDIAHEFGHGSY
jgi:hypothetical protein